MRAGTGTALRVARLAMKLDPVVNSGLPRLGTFSNCGERSLLSKGRGVAFNLPSISLKPATEMDGRVPKGNVLQGPSLRDSPAALFSARTPWSLYVSLEDLRKKI